MMYSKSILTWFLDYLSELNIFLVLILCIQILFIFLSHYMHLCVYSGLLSIVFFVHLIK